MALRSTQSYTTTLDIGAGAVRTTQMHVSCLTAEILVELSISNAFGFSAGQSAGVPTFMGASNDFDLEQIVEHNFVVLAVSNSLGLAAATGLDYEEDIIQYLGWTPRTILPVSNSMFSEDNESGVFVVRQITASASNTFGLTVEIIQAHNAVNTFGFVASVLGFQEFDITNSLGVEGTVDSADTEYERDGAQHCLKQHVTFTVTGNKCLEKDYRPFVGDGGDESYEAINTTPPTLGTATLTLTYPFVGPTVTLVLKNPAFGNTSTFSRSAIHRKTRGGDDIVAADPNWPTIEVQNLVIENICESDIDDVISFLNTSLGQKIGLLDWENRQWSGVILAPETDIVQTGINQWRFTLVFDGELA